MFGLSVIAIAAHDPQRSADGAGDAAVAVVAGAGAAGQCAGSNRNPAATRPTTSAPEPARPDAEAQKTGAAPALPPAPAEKTAAPIKEK